MGSVSVSSCRCCMFVSCVHPVAVLNAAFCMTCSLLMLVEDAIGDHTEEADFSHLFIDVIVRNINLTFSSASFPVAFKSAVVKPLFKKPTLDCDILKNFRPVSNLPYMSKLIEKVIAMRLVEHMRQNTIMEKFQSAYK